MLNKLFKLVVVLLSIAVTGCVSNPVYTFKQAEPRAKIRLVHLHSGVHFFGFRDKDVLYRLDGGNLEYGIAELPAGQRQIVIKYRDATRVGNYIHTKSCTPDLLVNAELGVTSVVHFIVVGEKCYAVLEASSQSILSAMRLSRIARLYQSGGRQHMTGDLKITYFKMALELHERALRNLETSVVNNSHLKNSLIAISLSDLIIAYRDVGEYGKSNEAESRLQRIQLSKKPEKPLIRKTGKTISL